MGSIENMKRDCSKQIPSLPNLSVASASHPSSLSCSLSLASACTHQPTDSSSSAHHGPRCIIRSKRAQGELEKRRPSSCDEAGRSSQAQYQKGHMDGDPRRRLVDLSVWRCRSNVLCLQNDPVYNVTEYMRDHPGGPDALLEVAGTDATSAYEDVSADQH